MSAASFVFHASQGFDPKSSMLEVDKKHSDSFEVFCIRDGFKSLFYSKISLLITDQRINNG